jgi:hypothetical protein
LKHIIHDWNDEKANIILKNCRKALRGKTNGRVLVVDAVLPEVNKPHPAKFVDLEMLVFCGSRERGESEFRRLFAAAGLQLNKIVRTQSRVSVLEAIPV